MKNKLTLSQKLVILMIIINMFFVIKDRFFGISNSSPFYIILVVIDLAVLISVIYLEKR